MRKIQSFFAVLLTSLLLAGAFCLPVKNASAEDSDNLLTGYRSSEIVSMMGLGFNIGNTFDAQGGNLATHERAWGNVPVTQDFVDAVYEAGFHTVRLPITWMDFISKEGDPVIDPLYLARVKEVVDYCYNDGMFVIINMHHENWINRPDFDKAYEEIGSQLGILWTQIATYFADYDQHLIFEGMNEPRMAGTELEWTGNDDAYVGVNYLNQVFVNAVLGTGLGHNPERCLMIPEYAASCSPGIMKSLAMPSFAGQSIADRLIVSVHSYTPYDFCLQDTKKTFSLKNSADTSAVDYVFRDIKNIFLDKGIPVIIGETGVTNSGNNTTDRANWARYMAEKASAYGIPIILWDNGSNRTSGGECHSYIHRSNCKVLYPEIIDALNDGWNAVERGSALKKENATGGQILSGRTIWSDPNGHKSASAWDATYIQIPSELSFYPKDGKIAFVYKGYGYPQMILDSEKRAQWWIPIEPDSTETIDGYKVSYFSTATILAGIAKYSITDPADLRYCSIITTGSAITGYELDVLGMPVEVNLTYMVNGQILKHTGKGLPKVPAIKGMKFFGWYTTPTFTPGSEFTGSAPEGVEIIYGMLGLAGDTAFSPDLTPAVTPIVTPIEIRRPSPTVTPTNTPAVTSTPTPVPSVEPDKPAENTTPSDSDSHPGRTILFCILVLLIVIAVIYSFVTFRKRKHG